MLEAVESQAHRAVANGVHAHLQARGVEGTHGGVADLAREVGPPAVLAGLALLVEVGLHEGRGLGGVLDHPVEEHIHGSDRDVRACVGAAHRLDVGHQLGRVASQIGAHLERHRRAQRQPAAVA